MYDTVQFVERHMSLYKLYWSKPDFRNPKIRFDLI